MLFKLQLVDQESGDLSLGCRNQHNSHRLSSFAFSLHDALIFGALPFLMSILVLRDKVQKYYMPTLYSVIHSFIRVLVARAAATVSHISFRDYSVGIAERRCTSAMRHLLGCIARLSNAAWTAALQSNTLT